MNTLTSAKHITLLAVFITLLFISLPAIAQTPGLGGVFTSTENILWLRASDLSDSIGNNVPVTLWPDRSGNNNDAIQSEISRKPLFLTDGGSYFSNQPAVQFDGAGDFLDIANNTSLNNMEGLTVFLVLKPNGTGTQAFLSKREAAGKQNLYALLYHENKIRLDVSSGSLHPNGSNLATTSSYIVTGLFNKNLAGNSQNLFRSSVFLNNIKNENNIGNNNFSLKIGRFNDGDERTIDADVAEILVYNTGFNNAQRIIVENVLANRYGIGIGTNLIFDNATYNHDIIGVGSFTTSEKHSASTGGGGGIYLSEYENSLDEVNEFVFAGHDGTEHDVLNNPVDVGSSDVTQRWSRSWFIQRTQDDTQDGGNTTISISFDFADAGLTPEANKLYVLLYRATDSSDFSFIPGQFASLAGDKVTFDIPNESFFTGFYTLGTFEGNAAEYLPKTWTSHKSGNWTDPLVWRNQNNQTGNPQDSPTREYDNIIIQNGHTITANINDLNNSDLLIREGGILDLGVTRGHFWKSIRGQGTLKINGDYFPDGIASQFIASIGGTTWYYGNANYEFATTREHNNLVIDLADVSTSLTLLADLTVNSQFLIKTGNFIINDNSSTARILTVRGDFRIGETIETGNLARLSMGTGNARHSITIGGDFTANGESRFCNLNSASYTSTPTDGYSDVIFNNNTQDQVAQFNAITTFYRIEINKGVDDTYKLFLQANDENKFRLWGRVNFDQGGTPPNRTNPNALGLLSGTVVIGNFVTIENLRSNSSNYDIDSDARIIVDGGKLLAPSGSILAIVLYGNLTVENGELLAYGDAGVTIRESGTLEIHGGEAKLYILRTSVIGGIHRGAYVQTGGTVTIDGTGGQAEHYRFSLPFPTNSFTMRGGTLNVLNPKSGGVGDMGGILIGSDRDNVLVDGGKVNATINRAKNFIINSSAPFYDLNLNKTVTGTHSFILAPHSGTAVTVPPQVARPLEVINNLTIEAGTHPATLDLNGYKAIVHGDMIIEDGAQFIGAGSNLSFTGARNSKFDVKSTTALFNVDTLSLQKESSGYQLEIFHGSESTPATALQINNYLKVEKGNLNYRLFPIHLKGDLHLADSIAKPVDPGRMVMNGSVQQNITVPVNNTTGFIGHLEIDNTAGVLLQESSLPMVDKLTLTNGIFNIQNFGLRVNGAITGTFDVNTMIATSGNHSDAGLIRRISADGLYVFPVGSVKGIKKLFSKLEAAYSAVSEDVWVQFNPVASELATLNNDLTNQALRYYWRISHSSVTNKPRVDQYQFFFDSRVLPATIPTVFVPGKIVDFVRSHEVVSNVDLTNSILIFNSGFDLEQGEYTAAQEDKFAGAVKVFYSLGSSSWASPANWSTPSSWSNESHTGITASESPQSGDIVQIGYHGSPTDNNYHVVKLNTNVQIGGLRFKTESGMDNPALIIENQTINVRLGNVSGRGSIAMNLGTNNPNLVADLGGFIDEENSNFIYRTNSNEIIPDVIEIYPNLILESLSSNSYTLNLPEKDILVKGNFHVRKGITAQLSKGTTQSADITVMKNLVLGDSETSSLGRLGFMATGLAKTVYVQGDVLLETDGSELFAENASGTLAHKLQLEGNIIQSDGSIRLYNNDINKNKVELELTGNSNGSYIRGVVGNKPSFYRILMNKGNSQAYTFTFEDDFTLWPTASGENKPIELKNGILELQDAGIDIALTEGTTHFFNIPSSAGLVLSNAKATAKGPKSVLVLNGLLKLENTGQFIMESESVLVYGQDNNATIEVHDNASLVVGSQLRRRTDYDTGILKYHQTGGTVKIWGNAPANTRGVFEILNEGSSFRFLGGEMIIVKGHNNVSEASFLLHPSVFEIGENALIRFGNGTETSTNNTIDVESSIPLPNVVINGNSGFNVRLQSLPLTITGNLELESGSTLNTNSLNLTLSGDFTNRGAFLPTTATTTFNGVEQILSGNTTFNKLVVSPASELRLDDVVESNLIVNDDLEILTGTLQDNGNTIELKKNLINNATHSSQESTGGLVFNGSVLQTITGNGIVGRMEIDNTAGVRLLNPLFIDNQLVFTNGLFDIQGYRLTLGPNHSLQSTGFSASRMIRVNGTIADAGVRYFIKGSTDQTVPVGITGGYAPVEFTDVTNPSSGYVDIRLIGQKHPNAIESDNLKKYWILNSTYLANFKGRLHFYYSNADVTGVETDYISARLLDATWSKLLSGYINFDDNYFEYPYSSETNSINGEYTAGASIPDVVLRFRSKGNGSWTDASNWENLTTSADVPSGGPIGQIVEINHTITIPNNERIAYKTFINEPGVLYIGSTEDHYLGEVDGNGRIYLETASLPMGKYDDFLASGKGTLEYGGSETYTILPTYFPTTGGINSLIFSGSSNRILPAYDLTIYNNLEIRDAVLLDNSLEDNSIHLGGDLIMDAGAQFRAGSGPNAKIVFNGNSPQSIVGDFIVQNQLNIVSVNNLQGVSIQGTTEIFEKLEFTSGHIHTTSNELRLLANATVTGFSQTSFVNGPLQKYGSGSFVFPVGSGGRMGRIAFEPNGTMAVGTILEASYFPTVPPNYETVEDPLERVSSVEYWQLESMGVKSYPSGKVRLYYEDSSFSGVTIPEALLVGRYDGAKWVSQGRNSVSGGTDTGYIESENVDGMGLFSFATDNSSFSNNPLPVELLSFTAKASGDAVLVSWTTATETNNDFFTVERSSDGINFEPVAFVQGAGTINQMQEYSATDNSPLEGISYYRLKQTDFDGSFEYSDMVAVQIRKFNEVTMQVYPNPVLHNRVNIRISDPGAGNRISLMLHDLQGRILEKTDLVADGNEQILYTLNIDSSVPAGMYLLVIRTDRYNLTERIIIK